MRTIAILPMKSLASVKQRLAGALGPGSRRALAQAMLADVLAALGRTRGLAEIALVTADHEIAAGFGGGRRVTVIDDGEEGGQSAAALVGIRHAEACGYERVLLVPGDTPLAEGGAIDFLLERSEADGVDVAIIPDRHRTGTNALLIAPPGCFEPSFGPGSLERHVQAARAAGLRHRVDAVESLLLDVDAPEDLAALAEELDARPAGAPRTRGSLRQLERLRGDLRAPEAAPAAVRRATGR